MTDSRLASAAGHDLVEVVRAAVEGGVTAVQVREKSAPGADFLDVVCRIAEIVPDHVAVIVNDRVDVFLAARAAGVRVAGVHVGQSDLPVDAVRTIIGTDAVLGLSASTEDELRDAASSPALIDYVGIGALHATATKQDAPTPLGHEGFARLVEGSERPAVAIGGVTRADLPGLRAAGAAGAAVVSAICSAPDPADAARELRAAWESVR
ncbi:thiamine phosphate synthase [Microbacterium sp. SLBN-146]|uniref:thiamine phosphate synthase n=1 Tax=Microbacterium sp. SLBN-146 TaxID=2768457 RepID=UPI0021B254C6|nr:thiamine phosphate synthase [Microbacterium sp. SLBN-146]